MKSNYEGFRGWIKYVRDYKDNKDFTSENLVEKELRSRIKQLETNYAEQSKLLALRNKTIDVLNDEITSLRKRNHELRKTLEKQCQTASELEILLKEKELSRRKSAGAVGGLKAKISVLKKDLARANHKILWLSNNQKAPTIEEIKAYETRMKEVEKKQKKTID